MAHRYRRELGRYQVRNPDPRNPQPHELTTAKHTRSSCVSRRHSAEIGMAAYGPEQPNPHVRFHGEFPRESGLNCDALLTLNDDPNWTSGG
jgi:hypothetical protein